MKLELVIQSGSLAGNRWELDNEYLTVGRGTECNVMFDKLVDRVVSSKHAYFEKKPDGFYLIDNDSTNGTFVNGEPIKKIRLNNNDEIQFGKNGPMAKVYFQQESITEEPAPTQFQPNFQPQFQQSPVNQEFQQFEPFQPPMPAPQVNWTNSVSNVGFGNSVVKPSSSQSIVSIIVAVVIWLFVFLSLPVVAFLIVGNLGLAAAIIASVVAFVPAMFYILPLRLLDRYDPEPLWILAMAFAWGALVSILFSALANDTVASFFGETASGVISAPVFEEGSKGLGVLLIMLFFRREFDDILDGIVYAGTIALGFATVENVLYYGRGFIGGGSAALMFLFFLRGILSPFAHVTFTSMTGIGCGISRESHKPIVRILMPILGYGCAVTLHAIWNGMAFLGGTAGFFIGYIVLEVPFFLIFIGFAAYIMYRQNKILKEMLAIDVAQGLITAEQLKIATSIFKSLTWQISGISGGKYRPRKRFLRAVGKLGLSHWHIQRATAAQGHTGSFQQNPILREEVLRWRDQV